MTKTKNIVLEINQLKEYMKDVECRFSYETEPILISSYIYELKSLEERYKYLLKTAKEQGKIENL